MARKCDLMGVAPMSGNKVSHANNKTRRKFNPNLQTTVFTSPALGRRMKFTVATATLRTINKHGGFDEFLVNSRAAKLTDAAQLLRRKIRSSLKVSNLLDAVLAKKRRSAKKLATGQ